MNRKNKKFKGTILFTVVSVMAILLVFLLGTLVLASSANKRTHKTYASTQAEFAARSAIESFFTAMESNDDIVSAVEGLAVGSPMYVEVNLNSTAYGTLTDLVDSAGTVHPHSIMIEAVNSPNDENFVLDTQKGWVQFTPVKISATAELGKEEGSVVAYIRKRSPEEIKQVPIKGLQIANLVDMKTCQGTYTGGFGFNICGNDAANAYLETTNDPKFETDLTFINGNVNWKTQAKINVISADTGTVVMGDLEKSNSNLFVEVKYDESKIKTENDVPYLYVENNLRGSAADGAIKIIAPDKDPYNVFCGWFTEGQQASEIAADLYMTYPSQTSVFGKETGSGSSLHKWAASLATGTNVNFASKGGNIYSKGNLILNACQLDGGVYVEGNLFLNQNSISVGIAGDIVCDHTVVLTDNFIKAHSGTKIVCENAIIGDETDFNNVLAGTPGALTASGTKSSPVQLASSDNTKYVLLISAAEYRASGKEIYPAKMEKSALIGDETQMIPNLETVRTQLNYSVDPTTGNEIYDPAVYLTEVPSGYDCTTNKYDNSSPASATITGNCTIEGSFEGKRSITIDPPQNGEIWVVLDNAKFENGLDLKVNDANRKINFLIKGTFQVKSLLNMTSSNVYADADVDEDTVININWYGAKKPDGSSGSEILLDNGGTIVGTAKAPYTELASTSQGAYHIDYPGEASDSKAPWVGNAFIRTIKKVNGNENNLFKVLCSGAPGKQPNIIPTKSNGDYEILYYNEY